MKYILEGIRSGTLKQKNLSGSEYAELIQTKERLIEVYHIEEKFDLLLGNYSELENSLLTSAVEHMVYGPQGAQWYLTQKNYIVRRIVNLLGSCRLYIDQTRHHLSRIYGRSTEIPDAFKSLVHSEYNSCSSYRIMDALRNYSQHRGYPFQAMGFPIKMVDPKNSKNMLFSITPLIQPKIMAKDHRTKRNILNELMSKGEYVDIKPIYREYIESLWRIHSGLRAMIAHHVAEWDLLVMQTVNDFYESTKALNMFRLGIIRKGEDGSIAEAEDLSHEMIQERRYYEHRNRNLINISKRYVTGEVVKLDV